MLYAALKNTIARSRSVVRAGFFATVSIWLGAALVAPGSLAAGELDELHAGLESVFRSSNMVGIAYAIVEDGIIASVQTLGSEDRAGTRPITADTLFRVGSISKNVTSLAALSLTEKGVFGLNDRLDGMWPEAAIANRWHATDPILFVHLLEHTAGLPGTAYRDYVSVEGIVQPPDYVHEARGRLAVRWRPGHYYSYANSGHTIAAAAMSRVTGKSFDDIVRDEVFRPLGMTTATFQSDSRPGGRLMPSYNSNGSDAGFWNMPIRPSGAMTASIADMAKLVRFYATAGVTETGSAVVSAQALARMREGETSLAARAGYPHTYGLGTFGFLAAETILWGHWGRVDGFVANFGYLPNERRGFALLSNTADRRAMRNLRRLIATYLVRDRPKPMPAPTKNITPDQSAAFAGWYKPFTHDMEMRAWIFGLLGLTRVASLDKRLVLQSPWNGFEPQPLVPTSDGFFKRAGEAIPTQVFVHDESGEKVLFGDNQESFRRISAASAWAALGAVALLAFAVVSSAGMFGIGLAQRVFGVRWPSGMGAVSCYAMAGVLLIALVFRYYKLGLVSALGETAMLGTVSMPSLELAALSVAWPAAGAAGVALMLTSWTRCSRWKRGYFVIIASAYVIAAAYLFAQGWLPLMTWVA